MSDLYEEISEALLEAIEDLDEKKKKKKKKKKGGKKDACYHKVRARYDVWPSAYASGALVKCRKVGAANWGNKSKKKNEGLERRTEEDGESFELDVRHYRLKDEYGEATVGYPKRYEDNLRVRNKLYSEYDHINEFTMGVYLMNDVNDGKIKTKKELELAIDELASYYKKIRIRKDPELTFLQKIGEEPIDTRPTHRPIDKDKIRTEFEKAMKDSRELDLRSRRPHAGLHSIDSSLMYQRTGKFNESYIKQVIKEELEAVLAEKKKKRKKAGTESSKESSLRDWFKRKGGKGSSSGWVDCNTCRKGKCKSCGRKSGEKRSKYPSCRPTPAACKERGRGKSWGKKSARKKK